MTDLPVLIPVLAEFEHDGPTVVNVSHVGPIDCITLGASVERYARLNRLGRVLCWVRQ